MPANRKNALIVKQNRLIATRLLQISLVVDDYVYQHKPISQRSAATYIKEISAYKDKCYRDMRSLQVIEKLTRCMNEIILEQQDLNGEYGEDNRVGPFQEISQDNEPMLSPVYSNPDEDLTQIPVDTSIHYRGTDLNNKKDEIETRQVTMEKVNNNMMEDTGADLNNTVRYFNDGAKVTSTEYPLNNVMEVIDLSDDIVDLINPGDDIFHHEPELLIHNAVSNLSLRDIEETFTPLSLECSQSILHTYYPTTNDTEYTIQKDEALTHVTSYVTASQKPVTKMVRNNITKIILPTNKKVVETPIAYIVENNITKVVLPTKKKVVETQISNEPTQNTQVMLNALNDTQTAKPSEQKTKKRKVKKKSNTKLPTVETNISRTVKKKTTAKAGNKKQANEIKPLNHEIANKTYTNPTQKVSKHSDQCDHQFPNTEDPLTNSTIQLNFKQITDKRCRNDTLPIYNNSVVNDLSWVENIRFVREISSNEYESFTEDQVFWNNYSLPSQWNVDDFNY